MQVLYLCKVWDIGTLKIGYTIDDMKRTIHSKLVRDNIPEILLKKNLIPEFFEMDGDEYSAALKEKIVEEARELQIAGTTQEVVDELADVFEVAESLAKNFGISMETVRVRQEEKRQERGGFEKRIFLQYVDEEDGEAIIE